MLRVTRVFLHLNPPLVGVVIPLWSPEQEILLSIEEYPELFSYELKSTYRFFVEVDLSATIVENLSFQSFSPVLNTPEYVALLKSRQILLTLLPYLDVETNPIAFSQGIPQKTKEVLELISQTIGEPLPVDLDRY